MGIYTIVSSIPGNYPGFSNADKVFYENTVDLDAILRVAREEKVDAIFTTGTDVAVTTIGYVCEELGLCGITYESALCVTNKARMKQHFLEGGVRTAEFCKVSSFEEAKAACRQISMPVIFKSVDMSGSRGIIRVDNEDEIENAFRYSLTSTHCDYILVEKFLEGYEIGVDGYVSEDDWFIVPHDKILHSNGATNVPVGHAFPFECSSSLRKDIEEQIKKALYALGLKKAFFNADVMICGDRSYIIEIGARCGATCIPELISIHYGIDYYEKMILNALGETVDFPRNPVCASIGEILRSDRGGLITDISVGPISKQVDEIVFDYSVGDTIRAFNVGPDRIGHVIAHGANVSEAREVLEDAKKAIKVLVKD